MEYNEKLRLFFKKEGYKQKEIAALLGYSPAMIGRYLKGSDKVNSDFIKILLKTFPKIDLQYIFGEDQTETTDKVSESDSEYNVNTIDVLRELQLAEDKIAMVKQFLMSKNL